MIKNYNYITLPTVGFLAGAIGWSGVVPLMPIGLVLLPLWYNSPNRVIAFTTVLFYLAAASHSLPIGSIEFYNSTVSDTLLSWSLALIFTSLPWFIFYSKKKSFRLVGLYLALLLISVPPFGITCWSHPLLSLGIWWPGGKFLACTMLLFLIALFAKFPSTILIPIVLGFVFTTTEHPTKDVPIKPLNTSFGGRSTDSLFTPSSVTDLSFDIAKQQESIALINGLSQGIYLLPESSGGRWGMGSQLLWQSKLKKSHTVLLNTTLTHKGKTRESVIIEVTKQAPPKTIYTQRQPVPSSMWNPFHEMSYQAHWFKNPIVEYQGRRVAFFICYEQFPIWPALHSLLKKPDLLCALSNVWWAKSGNIPEIQTSIMLSWSRLFDLPLVQATNK